MIQAKVIMIQCLKNHNELMIFHTLYILIQTNSNLTQMHEENKNSHSTYP
jgi:hypothetical protein